MTRLTFGLFGGIQVDAELASTGFEAEHFVEVEKAHNQENKKSTNKAKKDDC